MYEQVNDQGDYFFETVFTSKSQAIGRLGELYARHYLEEVLGWTILDSNWRLHRLPEIDIIARSKEPHIVFIEVKTRFALAPHRQKFDLAIQSCNGLKQTKIFKAAQLYLARERINEEVVKRFDLIALEIERFTVVSGNRGRIARLNGSDVKIFHIESAFAPL